MFDLEFKIKPKSRLIYIKLPNEIKLGNKKYKVKFDL